MPLCSNSVQSLLTSTLWCNITGTLLPTWKAKLHSHSKLSCPDSRNLDGRRWKALGKLIHHHWWKQLRIQNLYKGIHHIIIMFPDLLIQILPLCNCCTCPLCPLPVALALLSASLSSFMLSPAQPPYTTFKPQLSPYTGENGTWDSITHT